jgi:hypothetical protein
VDGGDTIFNPAGTGVTVTALGGGGGNGVSTADYVVGTAGYGESGGTNGDLNVQGQAGETGLNATVIKGGGGGNAAMGRGSGGRGVYAIDGNVGIDGASAYGGYGGGGGGAAAWNNVTGAIGGDGSIGVVIVQEFVA